MKVFSFSILLIFSIGASAQKPVINEEAYPEWDFSNAILGFSNNGKYLILSSGKSETVIMATDGSWKKKAEAGTTNRVFSDDSKYLLYNQGKDSLAMLKPGTGTVFFYPGISAFSIQKHNKGEWICYKPTGQPDDLVLKDISTKQEKIYAGVENWKFNEDGTILLLWKKNQNRTQLLQWVDMTTGNTFKIWEGGKTETPLIDSRHQQLVFKEGDNIWLYKKGSKSAVCILNKNSFPAEKDYTFTGFNRFTNAGDQLLISVKEKKRQPVKTEPSVVQIWSYLDERLPTVEPFDVDNRLAAIDLNGKFVQVFDVMGIDKISFPTFRDATDDIALVSTDKNFYEKWSIHRIINTSLLSIKTGERKKLDFLDNNRTVTLSASGKYLLYFNFEEQNYYSYEITTGRIRNLTEGLNVSWTDIRMDDMSKQPYPKDVYTPVWSVNDGAVLVCDRHDIWKLDPAARSKPVNLTNGYGKRNNIVFGFAFTSYQENGVVENQKIYLSAFNKTNKDNGFYKVQLNRQRDPELLTMGAYIFDTQSGYVPYGSDYPLQKAKDADVFIVRRMSATEAPNYFSTRDFKLFTKLSDNQPEKKYNWYTTELHTWKSLNGQELQGILYKPENFDPQKKYPVIFHYYERKSDGLNAYINPGPLCGGCTINIPTYVSQGYLVFLPDIYYKIGDPLQGTYDAVVSAARYLSGFSYVNSARMGLQGCSFGGIQTNYLVTHSNLFAAAVSSSGLANTISAYGSIGGDGGESHQEMYEMGQGRMGSSLWDKPQAYIKNSSIFNLARVTTPLLIMHTKKDSRCHFEDAVQLFTGLRRMGKRSWMLAYPEGDHGISGKEAEDFSIRMMEFFDHYLKDRPAPAWMIDGATDGRTPGPGLLTPEEQKKVDALMRKESALE